MMKIAFAVLAASVAMISIEAGPRGGNGKGKKNPQRHRKQIIRRTTRRADRLSDRDRDGQPDAFDDDRKLQRIAKNRLIAALEKNLRRARKCLRKDNLDCVDMCQDTEGCQVCPAGFYDLNPEDDMSADGSQLTCELKCTANDDCGEETPFCSPEGVCVRCPVGQFFYGETCQQECDETTGDDCYCIIGDAYMGDHPCATFKCDCYSSSQFDMPDNTLQLPLWVGDVDGFSQTGYYPTAYDYKNKENPLPSDTFLHGYSFWSVTGPEQNYYFSVEVVGTEYAKNNDWTEDSTFHWYWRESKEEKKGRGDMADAGVIQAGGFEYFKQKQLCDVLKSDEDFATICTPSHEPSSEPAKPSESSEPFGAE